MIFIFREIFELFLKNSIFSMFKVLQRIFRNIFLQIQFFRNFFNIFEKMNNFEFIIFFSIVLKNIVNIKNNHQIFDFFDFNQ